MLVSEAGADFLRYGAAERGHTRNTIKAYRQGLRRFAGWLASEGRGDLDDRAITPTLARRYMYYLDGRGLRPRTRIRLFLPLRALFGMLIEHGVVEHNPFLDVRLPKKDAARRPLVGDDELMALLEAATRQSDPLRAARDHAIVAVLVFCGLRRAELLNLRVSDIDLKEPALMVRRGKGEKSGRRDRSWLWLD